MNIIKIIVCKFIFFCALLSLALATDQSFAGEENKSDKTIISKLPEHWNGHETNGKIWNDVEFEVDLEEQQIGPFIIYLGIEPNKERLFKYELRNKAHIEEGGNFFIPITNDQSFMSTFSDDFSFRLKMQNEPCGVKGRFLNSQKATGSIIWRMGSVNAADGSSLPTCDKWVATPIK